MATQRIKYVRLLLTVAGSLLILTPLKHCEAGIAIDFVKAAERDYRSKIDELVLDGLDFKLGQTKGEIISNLGNPINIKTKEVSNIHNPQIMDRIYELFYAGLHIIIFKAKQQDREFIQYLSITSDTYKVKWGLNVGVSKKYVRNILGNPSEQEQGMYTYICGVCYEGGQQDIQFHFVDCIVNKIEWRFFIE